MSKLLGYENEIRRNDILSVQFNLLNKCPSRCKSCRKYLWPDDVLDVGDVMQALEVLKEEYGLQTVVFSGGDPLLYKDFDKLIDFCHDKDINFSLISTLVIRNQKILHQIAKKAYRIHVSVDSVSASNYQYIRGVDGFKIVSNNIKFIMQHRPEGLVPIRISATISKMNYLETYALYEFARNNKCLINFYFLHTWDDLKMDQTEIGAFYHNLKKIVMDENRYGNVISNARSLYAESGSPGIYEHCNHCYLPLINATINANGDIYPCCKLLDDNGNYGSQVEYAYGNIVGKTKQELISEFEKRKQIVYPIQGSLCDECAQRYDGLLKEIENIIDGKRKPLFF